MTTSNIRHKLYDYIRVAEDKKVKAIYTMLEEEIEELYDYWSDKKFVSALNARSADLKSGKVKGISWETARSQILNSKATSKKK